MGGRALAVDATHARGLRRSAARGEPQRYRHRRPWRAPCGGLRLEHSVVGLPAAPRCLLTTSVRVCGTTPAAVFAARFPGGLNDTVLYASAVEAYTSEPMLSFPAIGGGRGIFAAGASGLAARWGGVWAIQSVQRANDASARGTRHQALLSAIIP